MLSKSTDTPKILVWDLETTNLKADYGYLLCMGGKWLHEKKPFILSLTTHPGKKLTDDSALVKAAAEELNKADLWITYYGNRFDVPFINSRLLQAKQPPLILPPTSHLDIWRTVKYKLKLHSNRLASVIDFLNLGNKKTPVLGPQWIDSMAGDIKARKYVYDHCKSDVLALEEAYLILRPLIDKHPKMKLKTRENEWPCPNCGGRTQSKGLAATPAGLRKQRRVCFDCGHPSFGRVEKMA